MERAHDVGPSLLSRKALGLWRRVAQTREGLWYDRDVQPFPRFSCQQIRLVVASLPLASMVKRNGNQAVPLYLLRTQEVRQEPSQNWRYGPEVVIFEAVHGLPDGAFHKERGADAVYSQGRFAATTAQVAADNRLSADTTIGGDEPRQGVEAGGTEELPLFIAANAPGRIQQVQRPGSQPGDAFEQTQTLLCLPHLATGCSRLVSCRTWEGEQNLIGARVARESLRVGCLAARWSGKYHRLLPA